MAANFQRMHSYMILASFGAVYLSVRQGNGYLVIPDVPKMFYMNAGDITLGFLLPVTEYYERSAKRVGKKVLSVGSYKMTEAIAYQIKRINKILSDNLINLKIGFAIFDTAMKDTVATLHALRFIEVAECGDSCYDITAAENHLTSVKVAAVLGYMDETSIEVVSDILNNFNVPHKFEPYATAYRLKRGKEVKKQTTFSQSIYGMKKIIKHFGWQYVNILYDETFIRSGDLDKLFPNICFGVIETIDVKRNLKYYDDMIHQMSPNKNIANITLVMGNYLLCIKLLKAINNAKAQNKFIWIFYSDLDVTGISHYRNESLFFPGMFYLGLKARGWPWHDFSEHLHNLTSFTENPWITPTLDQHVNCPTVEECPDNETKLEEMVKHDGHIDPLITRLTSSILDFINMSTLVSDHSDNCGLETAGLHVGCDSKNLHDLVTKGESSYVMNQVVGETASLHAMVIASLKDAKKVVFEYPPIWDYYEYFDGKNTPVSVCGFECEARAIKKYTDARSCCWKCEKCHHNDIVVNDQTSCQRCPLYKTPNERTNFTTCKKMPVIYVMSDKSLVVIILSTSGFGMVAILFWLTYNAEKLLQDKQLFYQLLAVAFGFTVIIIAVFPITTKAVCYALYWLFALAFYNVYMSTLVRILSKRKSHATKRKALNKVKIAIIALSLIKVAVSVVGFFYFIPEPVAMKVVEDRVLFTCHFSRKSSMAVMDVIIIDIITIFVFNFRALSKMNPSTETKWLTVFAGVNFLIWASGIMAKSSVTEPTSKGLVLVFILSLILWSSLFLAYTHSRSIVPRKQEVINSPQQDTSNAKKIHFETTRKAPTPEKPDSGDDFSFRLPSILRPLPSAESKSAGSEI